MTQWSIIPGETPIDPSKLKHKYKWIKTRSELNPIEFAAILDVNRKYFGSRSRRILFELEWITKLHGEMFGSIWEWGGQYRTRNFNVGIPWNQCQTSLLNMLEDLKVWDVSLLNQATRLHHRAVQIHPFENGNGRWARLLSNLWLNQNDHAIVVWPDETIGTKSEVREEYLVALHADDDGDITPLHDLHERFLKSSDT